MKALHRFTTGFSVGFVPIVALSFFAATVFAPCFDARAPYYQYGPVLALVVGCVVGWVFVVREVKV